MNQAVFDIGGAEYSIESDLHTHTRFSHGRGSIEDNVKAAADIRLKQIAITDHGPGHIGFGVPRKKLAEIKAEIIRLRREYTNIEILFSVEANIMGPDGKLDINPEEYGFFDFICAGWHFGAFDGLTPAGIGRTIGNLLWSSSEKAGRKQLRHNTNMISNAIKSGGIKFITHPGDKAPVDMLEIAAVCAQTGTLLEINTNHMSLTPDIIKDILLTDVLFIINSDAHSPGRIGDFQAAIELIRETGIDPKRIVNLKKL